MNAIITENTARTSTNKQTKHTHNKQLYIDYFSSTLSGVENTIKTLPKIQFKIEKRHMLPTTRKWLNRNKDYLTKTWIKKGPTILRSIQKQCGFNFPAKTVAEGMTIYLSKRHDRELGNMEETKPLKFSLYLNKSDTWKDIKPTLVHELIHCLMWQKFYFDLRTGKPTFFADVFADELMTSVVECLVLGRKPGYLTCNDAIDYALDEAVARLSTTDRREKLVKALMVFFKEYSLKMKRKESNILKERELVLGRLPSLLPESID